MAPKTELDLYLSFSSGIEGSGFSERALVVVVTVSEAGNWMGSGKGGGVGAAARGAGEGARGRGAACDAEPSRCRFTSDAFSSLVRLQLGKKLILINL